MDTTTDNSKFLLPISVIAAGLLIAGAVLWNGSGAPRQPGAAAAAVNVKDLKADNAPFIGRADAPVTIAFWSDFQCSYCKNFELGTLPQIIEKYVDTGKAKIIFLDFAFLGQDSIDATVYNHAVWKLYPEKYLEWRTAMYESQDGSGDQGFGDASSIDALNATISGLDAARIAADAEANREEYLREAEAERKEGQKFGMNSTPSFVIGKKSVVGALPFAAFEAAIEETL